MRVFVALDLPEKVRSAVGALIARLRPLVPRARWVRIEGTHVTLKFIGEVSTETVASIQSVLPAISLPDSIDVSFRGLGFFPNEKRPRLFWAGIEAGDNLGVLAAKIEGALEPLGISRESRNFSPHLTLARLDNPGGLDALREAIASPEPFEFGNFTYREFHLYQSVLKHGGAEYTRLASYPFVGSAQ